jgi:hypothetical protein
MRQAVMALLAMSVCAGALAQEMTYRKQIRPLMEEKCR